MTTTYYDENYLEVSEHDLYELYDEMLDDVTGAITIGTLTYMPSDVLKEVDPIAYQVGFNDYIDSMMQDDQLYEDESEFIDELLTEWADENIPHDTLDIASPETIHHVLEDLHSSGILELVEGELDIHPSHTFEGVRETLLARIECMN